MEPMRLEHIANTPVKTFDHDVGFGRPRIGQPVFDVEVLAQSVKLVCPVASRSREANKRSEVALRGG